jgi:replication factor A1
VNIKEALNSRNKIDVKGIIVEKGKERNVNLKDGTVSQVCDCIMEDETAKIKLTLWGEDIKRVSEGSLIQVSNGYTKQYKGEVALNVGKFGKLTA